MDKKITITRGGEKEWQKERDGEGAGERDGWGEERKRDGGT